MSASLPPPPSGFDQPNLPTQDERQWALFAHVASLANFVVPFGAILGPLVVWLSKKETSRFVDRHGRESLQFQASFLAYHMVFICGGVGSFFAAIFVADASKATGDVLGPLAMLALFGLIGVAFLLRVFVVVMMIIAATKANAGEDFRYPLTIRLLGSGD